MEKKNSLFLLKKEIIYTVTAQSFLLQKYFNKIIHQHIYSVDWNHFSIFLGQIVWFNRKHLPTFASMGEDFIQFVYLLIFNLSEAFFKT